MQNFLDDRGRKCVFDCRDKSKNKKKILGKGECVETEKEENKPLRGRSSWYTHWTDYTLTSRHDANQLSAHFQARIDRDIDREVKEFLAKHPGMTKKAFTNYALRLALSDPDVASEVGMDSAPNRCVNDASDGEQLTKE